MVGRAPITTSQIVYDGSYNGGFRVPGALGDPTKVGPHPLSPAHHLQGANIRRIA